MDWSSLLNPGVLAAVVVLAGTIYTAKSGTKDSLPQHQDRELKRMSVEGDRQRRRMDHIEAWNVSLSDHIDVLENHIWRSLPPPPPPRPRYIPFVDSATDSEE